MRGKMMKHFFCAMEMKLPEMWSPLANTVPALAEVQRNALHKETCKHGRDSPNITFFNTAILEYYFFVQGCFPRILLLCPGLLSSDIPLTCCVSCSAHTAFSRMLCATRPTGSKRHTHSLAVCSSRRKPRNCLWRYPRKLHCRKF